MDNGLYLETKAKLLEQLKIDLADDYTAAEYVTEEESEIPGGEVAVMFDSLGMNSNEALAEIFFLPDDAEDAAVCYFECVMIISDSLDDADMQALNLACAQANSISPAGSFIIDDENGRLLFKLGVPVPTVLDEDSVYAQMNAAVGSALSIVDRSIDELVGLVGE